MKCMYEIFLELGNESKKEANNVMEIRMRNRVHTALKESMIEKMTSMALPQPNLTPSFPLHVQVTSPYFVQQSPFMSILSDNAYSNASIIKSPQPENYRIMFHIITQDHKQPDLIWNESTRLELRSALETVCNLSYMYICMYVCMCSRP